MYVCMYVYMNTKTLCWNDTQAMLQVELSEALCTDPVADNVDDEWTFIRDYT